MNIDEKMMTESITFTPKRSKIKFIKLSNGLVGHSRTKFERLKFYLFDSQWKKKYALELLGED